jgi:hypothetical protein
MYLFTARFHVTGDISSHLHRDGILSPAMGRGIDSPQVPSLELSSQAT